MNASPYQRHVFVCTDDHARGCGPKGGPRLARTLRRLLRDRGLRGDFAVTATRCMGGCAHGPNVIVHPEGAWYGGVGVADIPELIQRHLVEGELIPSRLRSDVHRSRRVVDQPPLAGWPRRIRDQRGDDHVLQRPPRSVWTDDHGAWELIEALVDVSRASSAGSADLAVRRGTEGAGLLLSVRPTLFRIQSDIGVLGRALGVEGRAAALNRGIDQGVESLLHRLPATRPRVLFLDALGASCGPWDLPGTVLNLAGAVSVGAELGLEGRGPVDHEAVLASRPEVLVVEGTPGLAAALRSSNPALRVVPWSSPPASHRLVEHAERLADAIHGGAS